MRSIVFVLDGDSGRAHRLRVVLDVVTRLFVKRVAPHVHVGDGARLISHYIRRVDRRVGIFTDGDVLQTIFTHLKTFVLTLLVILQQRSHLLAREAGDDAAVHDEARPIINNSSAAVVVRTVQQFLIYKADAYTVTVSPRMCRSHDLIVSVVVERAGGVYISELTVHVHHGSTVTQIDDGWQHHIIAISDARGLALIVGGPRPNIRTSTLLNQLW